MKILKNLFNFNALGTHLDIIRSSRLGISPHSLSLPPHPSRKPEKGENIEAAKKPDILKPTEID
jgi:hypothetical protein